MKKKYEVYARTRVDIEGEPSVVSPWEYAGTTQAASEKGAIANVHYRMFGRTSRYLPIQVSGHWEKYIEYEARENADME